MRKTIVLMLVFSSVIFSQISTPQFIVSSIRQQTFPGDVRRFSYAGNTLFTVGYNISIQSFFAKSTNEGATWEVFSKHPFTPKDNLKGISFVDASTGWVVGDKGIIYKTTNGGASWISQTDTLVYKGALNDVHFLNSNLGYACGGADNNNSLIKTTNGGALWSVVALPVQTGGVTLYQMYWESEQKGIIIASSGKYFVTTDAGATWISNTVPTPKGALYGITRSDANTYYLTGSQGQVYKSSDGGLTYNLLTSVSSSSMYGIEFLNSNEGFVFGSSGQVYKTKDAGLKWDVLFPFSSEVLRTSIVLQNKFIIGGYISNIFVTTDKGQSWNSLANSGRDFYGIYAESDHSILISGGSSSSSRGEINLTANGGNYWKRPPLVLSNVLYDVVKFGSYIYTCGQGGAYFISSDNGDNWQNFSIAGSTAKNYKLFFMDQNNGYMTTGDGKILKTTNRGVTWSTAAQFSSTYLYDIKMTSPTRGFAVGSGEKIFETYDGVNWLHGALAQPTVQITGLYMLDESRGYICGENGSVFKTDDGFRSITLMTDTASLRGVLIHDVLAFNDSVIWAVGQKGKILRSSSATKMVVVSSPTEDDLTALAKANDSTLVVSGFNGSIFKVIDKTKKTVGVEAIASAEESFELQQNYPNPFNPNTRISYSLPSQQKVDLKVYDLLGKQVAVIFSGYQAAGKHTFEFNASELPSGIYIYQLNAGTLRQTRKMVLLK